LTSDASRSSRFATGLAGGARNLFPAILAQRTSTRPAAPATSLSNCHSFLRHNITISSVLGSRQYDLQFAANLLEHSVKLIYMRGMKHNPKSSLMYEIEALDALTETLKDDGKFQRAVERVCAKKALLTPEPEVTHKESKENRMIALFGFLLVLSGVFKWWPQDGIQQVCILFGALVILGAAFNVNQNKYGKTGFLGE
jgi:hypothetical protein